MEKSNLDYASMNPLDSRVFKAMLPYFKESYGNPVSFHERGSIASDAIEEAREKVAPESWPAHRHWCSG